MSTTWRRHEDDIVTDDNVVTDLHDTIVLATDMLVLLDTQAREIEPCTFQPVIPTLPKAYADPSLPVRW